MAEQVVRVECYEGYKGQERPMRIVFEAQTLEIADVEDRWYDVWSLTAFRSAGKQAAAKYGGRQTR